MIMSTQLLNLIPGAILGIPTATATIQVWHIYVLSLITASSQVLGGPASLGKNSFPALFRLRIS